MTIIIFKSSCNDHHAHKQCFQSRVSVICLPYLQNTICKLLFSTTLSRLLDWLHLLASPFFPPVAVGPHLCIGHEHRTPAIIAGAGHAAVAGGARARLCGAGAAARRVQAARRTVRFVFFKLCNDDCFSHYLCFHDSRSLSRWSKYSCFESRRCVLSS
jgi:hypothetical protein